MILFLRQFFICRTASLARPGKGGHLLRRQERPGAVAASSPHATGWPGDQPLRAATGSGGDLDRLLAVDARQRLQPAPRPRLGVD